MKEPKRSGAVFVYHGSNGIAGGYAAKFLEGLGCSAKVHAFVNCNYIYSKSNSNPSVSIHKIFFPITDRWLKGKSVVRYAVRFLELLVGYLIVLVCMLFIRPKVSIYSPITDLAITKIFVVLAKRISEKLAVVVHDSQSLFDVNEKYRDSVYVTADVLIVHNKHSQAQLMNRLVVSNAVVFAPFPWSLAKINQLRPVSSCNIVMIGHVRPSKGIDFLLSAFQKYKSSGGALGLTVAGSMASSARDKIFAVASRVISSTLDDQQFLAEIASSKFTIMPYRPGYSNSSVHYCAVIHCGTPFICSDIDLFRNFEDGVDCLKFRYGDHDSFASVLRVAEAFSDSDCKRMAACALEKMRLDMLDFDKSISKLFDIKVD